MEKKKKADEPFQWFVETLDSHTNKVVTDMLHGISQMETSANELTDNEGKPHSVYEVPDYQFVGSLQKSRRNLTLNFLIWGRRNKNEAIRPWTMSDRSPAPLKVILKKTAKKKS